MQVDTFRTGWIGVQVYSVFALRARVSSEDTGANVTKHHVSTSADLIMIGGRAVCTEDLINISNVILPSDVRQLFAGTSCMQNA